MNKRKPVDNSTGSLVGVNQQTDRRGDNYQS